MIINDEVLGRFLQDKCTPEEAEAVFHYLEANPGQMEKLMTEEDWTAFRNSVSLHPAVSQKMLTAIADSSFKSKRQYGWLRYAAAVIVPIGVGLYFFLMTGPKKANRELATETVSSRTNISVIANTTSEEKRITLADGSTVVLEPGSEISLDTTFGINSRNVKLKGEALFKIAKDRTRPFSVFSGDVATTALGTQFKVKSIHGGKEIHVILYEGKVVVKSSDSLHPSLKKDFMLNPGQELVYNKPGNTVLLRDISGVGKELADGRNPKAKNAATETDSLEGNNWYMFNNQPLPQVFDLLSSMYNTKIIYARADLKGMRYIGRVDKTDSIQHILKDISLLNDLLLVKEEKGYRITIKK